MKKRSKAKMIMTIIIGIVCIILTTVMFAQFKTVEETDITGIEGVRETELRAMLSDWKIKYEEVQEKLAETNKKMEEYKEKISLNQESSELLEEELEQTNMLVGKTDVTGEGIIITLTDNNNYTFTSYDLIKLVNELRLAGAEAISINNKRVVNMTDIFNIDNNVLMNTEDRLISPYVVRAIGNQTYLASALELKSTGYIDSYKNSDATIELRKEKTVTILASTKNMDFKYAKEVE